MPAKAKEEKKIAQEGIRRIKEPKILETEVEVLFLWYTQSYKANQSELWTVAIYINIRIKITRLRVIGDGCIREVISPMNAC